MSQVQRPTSVSSVNELRQVQDTKDGGEKSDIETVQQASHQHLQDGVHPLELTKAYRNARWKSKTCSHESKVYLTNALSSSTSRLSRNRRGRVALLSCVSARSL